MEPLVAFTTLHISSDSKMASKSLAGIIHDYDDIKLLNRSLEKSTTVKQDGDTHETVEIDRSRWHIRL